MEMLPASVEGLPRRESLLDKVDVYIVLISRIMFYLAGAAMVGMWLLVVADIIGIKLLKKPVPGGTEFVTFLAVVTIGFAIPYVAHLKGHVAVDLVVGHLPPRVQSVVKSVTVFLSCILFAVAFWYTWDFAGVLRVSGEVSMTQKIPFYPFVYGLAVCYLVTLFVLIPELVRAIVKVARRWTP